VCSQALPKTIRELRQERHEKRHTTSLPHRKTALLAPSEHAAPNGAWTCRDANAMYVSLLRSLAPWFPRCYKHVAPLELGKHGARVPVAIGPWPGRRVPLSKRRSALVVKLRRSAMCIAKPSPRPFVLAPVGATYLGAADGPRNMPLLTELSPHWTSRCYEHVAPLELTDHGARVSVAVGPWLGRRVSLSRRAARPSSSSGKAPCV
jgi:hypothetical protein